MLPKVNVSIFITITVDIAIKANNETTVSIITIFPYFHNYIISPK